MKQSAKCGIIQKTSGVVVGIEKRVLSHVWQVETYWENPATASLDISKIKVEIEKRIKEAFERDGRISIGELYDFLEEEYGFAPCNLSSFLAGFLLKEYAGEPFRYSDSSGGHEQMTQDKLAEMLGNYIGKSAKPKPTYIVQMTPEEKAFYELTEEAWGIPVNSCSSVAQAAGAVSKKMHELRLPVWCLEEVDTASVYTVVQMYIELVQDKDAHTKALEIGKKASTDPSLAKSMRTLLTKEKCQQGMRDYLHTFEGGTIMEIAAEINAKDNVVADICKLFEVENSSLWDRETGEGEIRKLQTEYSVVKESNAILNTFAHSFTDTKNEWRERLKFIGISWEALKGKYPALGRLFEILLKIYKSEDVRPEQVKAFHTELVEHGTEIKEVLNNAKSVFGEVYEPYLEDLGPDDIAEVKTGVGTGLFKFPNTECNSKVKEAADEFRKSRLKSQLLRLWHEKTGTKNPREWSNSYRTPILCCVSEAEFASAKKTFATLNRNAGTDSEIKSALEFLQTTKMFDVLADEKKRNAAFKRDIIGVYTTLLPDLEKVKEALGRLSVDVYEWRDNPSVKNKVAQLAKAEYNAGGSDKVLSKIDEMDDGRLKKYLKQLVKDSITVGIEILANGG